MAASGFGLGNGTCVRFDFVQIERLEGLLGHVSRVIKKREEEVRGGLLAPVAFRISCAHDTLDRSSV